MRVNLTLWDRLLGYTLETKLQRQLRKWEKLSDLTGVTYENITAWLFAGTRETRVYGTFIYHADGNGFNITATDCFFLACTSANHGLGGQTIMPISKSGKDSVARSMATAAAQASSKLSDTRFLVQLTSGLTATFGPGRARVKNGFFDFPGGSVTVPGAGTWHVMVDIQDKSLHCLYRSIHRGGIHIATITAGASGITKVDQPAEFVIPRTRLPRFKAKLRTNAYIRVACFGDSLTEGAGGTPRWTDLLFYSTGIGTKWEIPRLKTNADVELWAVGGQTAHFGLAQIGKGVTCNSAQGMNQMITYGAAYQNRNIATPVKLRESKILTGNYDLVFVEYGANGGTNSLAHVENVVRAVRDTGAEVIIVTSNERFDQPTSLEADGYEMARIADAYGCELADTHAYVRERRATGVNVHYSYTGFQDIIHMSTEGHECWASALRSIINDVDQESDAPTFDPSFARIIVPDVSGVKKFPNSCEVMFDPSWTDGTREVAGTTGSGSKNPSINFGGRGSSNYITRLNPGQSAVFGTAHGHAFDLLYEQVNVFTGEVWVTGSSGWGKFGNINSAYNGIQKVALMECIPQSAFGSTTGYANKAVKVICVTGKMDVVGAVFHTWKNSEILSRHVDFVGSWSDVTWTGGHPAAKATSNSNDWLSFEFIGTGCQILIAREATAGIIEAYIDGRLVETYDAYDAVGGKVKSFDLFAEQLDGFYDRGYGKHQVKLRISGQNASTTAGPKMTFLTAYAFDSR